MIRRHPLTFHDAEEALLEPPKDERPEDEPEPDPDDFEEPEPEPVSDGPWR